MELIDTRLLSMLDNLKITTKRPLPGFLKGNLRSPKKGSAIEFADFRDYAPGDDLKNVDWNIYARLERPFIKLFEEEEDISVRILLDCSKSMDWGEPNKFSYAKSLAGCLGYISLRHLHRTSIYGFSDKIGTRFLPHRGLPFVPGMLGFLDELKPDGRTDFLSTCHQVASERFSSGLVIVISDLFDDRSDKALGLLADKKRDVKVFHILSPQEMNPEVLGDLRLVDMETGRKREVSITPRMLNRYKDNLNSWMSDLRRSCHKRGMDYISVMTSTPLDILLFKTLRQRGILS